MTKKEREENKWALLGAVAGVCAAPFTGGASLFATGGLGLVGGKVFGKLFGGSSDDNEGIDQAQKNYQLQLEQWKLLSEERRKDLENSKKDKDEVTEKINSNNEEIERLRTILNNPDSSEEDKNNARKRLVILEDENNNLKGRLRDLEDKIKNIESDKPPIPTNPISVKFPKFSNYDKLLIAGVLALIIYFLFLRDNKNK